MATQLRPVLAVPIGFLLASSVYTAAVLYPLRALCFFGATGTP